MRNKLLNIIRIGLLVLGIYVICSRLPIGSKEDLLLFFQQMEKTPLSGVIFIIITVVGSLCFMPISWMKAIAAIYFGLTWGFIYSLLAAIISCSLSFGIARLLGKSYIQRMLNKFIKGKGSKFLTVSKNIEKYSFEYIFLLRNVYVVPFTPINYFFGITNISFKKYLLASILGMIPGTFTYTFFFAKSIDILENWRSGIIPISFLLLYYLLMGFLKKKLEARENMHVKGKINP
ncbi:TVP38/TMEM64 family protein [Alkaliphilus transvaalensis]|uniref:TVP38/TMEM64 family protein n=1 Tax=Alkaliphilus transvaalensis TaxID=114628 RepID=UPI00047C52FC|nr:VTT domain-containing protein [Alkaliphilus transvaalensis]